MINKLPAAVVKIGIALVAGAAVAAVSLTTGNAVPSAGALSRLSSAELFVDPDTGCHYLAKGGYSSLTPRNDRSGKQICEPRTGGQPD